MSDERTAADQEVAPENVADSNRRAREQMERARAGPTRRALATEEANALREIDAYGKRIAGLQTRLREIQALRAIPMLDDARMRLGASALEISGTFKPVRGDGAILRDARLDLALGGSKLVFGYFGAKNYGEWIGQREDHSYGRGPAHGSIVFSIGVARRFQRSMAQEAHSPRDPVAPPPQADEIEAALYALDALESGAITAEQLRALASVR